MGKGKEISSPNGIFTLEIGDHFCNLEMDLTVSASDLGDAIDGLECLLEADMEWLKNTNAYLKVCGK